jgi:hypothetical protein
MGGGMFESAFGDRGNESGSGLNAAGDYLSELGGDLTQLEYEHPNLVAAGEWMIDAVTGVPIMKTVDYLAKKAMNADPTNVHGINAVNGMDKESDDARQAAADAQEIERLGNRADANAPTSSAGDYTNEMDKASDAYGEGGAWVDPNSEVWQDPGGDAYSAWGSGSGSGSGGLGGDYGGWAGGDFGSDFGGDAGSDAGGFSDWGGGVDFSGSGGWGGGGGDYGGDSGGGGGGLGGWSPKIVRLAAAGGSVAPVPLQSGGFVFPADVVAALGAGSSSAGLEVLAKRFGARPVQGKGHGQSDDVHAAIDGKQPARVARDEAILDAAQVQKAGGPKKLYAMMERVRKQATGSPKQMRVVNAAKVLR